jgi:hypothetical protein
MVVVAKAPVKAKQDEIHPSDTEDEVIDTEVISTEQDESNPDTTTETDTAS